MVEAMSKRKHNDNEFQAKLHGMKLKSTGMPNNEVMKLSGEEKEALDQAIKRMEQRGRR